MPNTSSVSGQQREPEPSKLGGLTVASYVTRSWLQSLLLGPESLFLPGQLSESTRRARNLDPREEQCVPEGHISTATP